MLDDGADQAGGEGRRSGDGRDHGRSESVRELRGRHGAGRETADGGRVAQPGRRRAREGDGVRGAAAVRDVAEERRRPSGSGETGVQDGSDGHDEDRLRFADRDVPEVGEGCGRPRDLDLCAALGGCYIDFMSGEYTINPLEPKAWTDGIADIDLRTPDAFKRITRLSQHIAFLKDFFRSYKDFTDIQIDTIEILLSKLYARFGITDMTDYSKMKPSDFPVMEDFYKLCEEEFMTYDTQRKYLYTEETLQDVCLGIHSMCVGAESKYFNGHTNITDSNFLVFGVKGLMDTNKRLKDAMLFNILSYMSNELLGKGNTAASIDELYLFLTNMTAIEYIRNAMKRVRKKDSSIILASQNIEDFLIPAIRELTKPLFSIPTHQFLFNPGQINPQEYMDALQVEPSEFELIKYPERGTCLYRCGNERYLLQVIAPDYKSAMFGRAGGR